jgi:hypothetical protein
MSERKLNLVLKMYMQRKTAEGEAFELHERNGFSEPGR